MNLNFLVRKRFFQTICLISIIIPTASAQAGFFYDGQDLYSECSKGERDGQNSLIPFGICSGFIAGVVDDRVIQKKNDCTPEGLKVGTIKDIVMKYLRDKPEQRTLSAALIVNLAIAEAYPACRE